MGTLYLKSGNFIQAKWEYKNVGNTLHKKWDHFTFKVGILYNPSGNDLKKVGTLYMKSVNLNIISLVGVLFSKSGNTDIQRGKLYEKKGNTLHKWEYSPKEMGMLCTRNGNTLHVKWN